MEEKGAGYLRVGVKNGGCAGMEYVMDYATAPEALDEIVEDNDVTILIDAKAVLFLLGSEVDYEVTPLHEKFVFKNPNQTDACGCGESGALGHDEDRHRQRLKKWRRHRGLRTSRRNCRRERLRSL